ncbi:MAG: sigma-70 family RNA polymerase sigma factor [Bacteroidales bacterium]|nr:sigma-70 family RNA polymerase sigma factor [Bacteroidales bacterium]
MSDDQMIDRIRKGDQDQALDALYKNYPAFLNSFVKSGGKRNDAEDIFQDALLIFIEKILNRNFTLTCSINSYLFSICRNLSLVYFRDHQKKAGIKPETGDDQVSLESIEKFIERERQFSALDRILVRVGKKCMEILNLFYFSGLNMNAIAIKLGFSSEVSAKTQKYKCIEKARKLTESVMAELKTEWS